MSLGSLRCNFHWKGSPSLIVLQKNRVVDYGVGGLNDMCILFFFFLLSRMASFLVPVDLKNEFLTFTSSKQTYKSDFINVWFGVLVPYSGPRNKRP